MIYPTIVIMAYERSRSLNRLLLSLNRAEYPDGPITLHITIGKKQDNQDVFEVAREFTWNYGEKVVERFEEVMSLTEHYYRILEYVEKYGKIILLEDDLIVSDSFFTFADQALDFYDDDPNIAGISLNNLWFHGITKFPFQPLKSNCDTYFMQIPYYHGQAFNSNMIQRWIKWRSTDGWNDKKYQGKMPQELMDLARVEDEWFPEMTGYLIDTNQYFVFPYHSLSSNFGEIGKHFTKRTNFLQTPIVVKQSEFSFALFSHAVAIYDSFQELVPSSLRGFDTTIGDVSNLTIDMNGVRRHISTKFVLTTRLVKDQSNIIASFAGNMKPPILNVIYGITGDKILLTTRENVEFSSRSHKVVRNYLHWLHNTQTYERSTISVIIDKFRKMFSRG